MKNGWRRGSRRSENISPQRFSDPFSSRRTSCQVKTGKKRVRPHVPVMNLPAKELPRTIEPLTMDEQKALTRLIRENIYTQPEEAFLTALCFYHGLSTSQIRGIKTSDVDVERGMIRLED